MGPTHGAGILHVTYQSILLQLGAICGALPSGLLTVMENCHPPLHVDDISDLHALGWFSCGSDGFALFPPHLQIFGSSVPQNQMKAGWDHGKKPSQPRSNLQS